MADPVWVDGSTPLNSANLTKLQTRDEKGQASGYASLDATGKVAASQLPTAAVSIPTGAALDFFGTIPPTGFLLCDGSPVSRTTYAALFAVISTQYGIGDGSTTFNVPDTRGRMTVGYASGGHADVGALGNNEGLAAVSFASRRPRHPHTNGLSLPNHVHSITDPGHTHGLNLDGVIKSGSSQAPVATGGGYGADPANPSIVGALAGINTTNNPTSLPALGGTIGAAGTALDAPAYLVANKIIKT